MGARDAPELREQVCVCAQSRPTLCNPMDSSPPDSSAPGILQARILERMALSLTRGLLNSGTVTYHIPLSMGFPSQEYWSGVPFPSPEDLPDPGIKPGSPTL